MNIKKKDIVNFGVDYIKVQGVSDTIESINFGLTSDDAYMRTDLFPGFLVKKVNKVMNFEYKIVINKGGYDCFAYHKGTIQGGIETNDRLDVYGNAFRVFNNLSEIIKFIKDNMTIVRITRFDLALDLELDTLYIHKNFKEIKQKSSTRTDDKGKIQTFYIGDTTSSKNRYKVLRCYNKTDEIIAKNKQKLYPDYLKKKTITRMEFEFRSELCKKITLDQLLDDKYIFNIFLSYIKKYTTMFDKFKFDITKLNVQKKRVDIEDLKFNEIVNSRYLKVYLGYSKKLIKIGACPVDILLRENLIKETTKKDIVLSIKDGVFRQDMYEFGLNVRNSRHIFSKEIDDVIYLTNKDSND